MYSENDLERAVAAGVITPDAAGALRQFFAERTPSSLVDEEQFRLITGFNDIFVVIASILLLSALAWIGASLGMRLGDTGPSPLSGLFVAGAAWGLSEFFTRRRRMALPSIVLLLAFAGGVMECAMSGIVLLTGEASYQNNAGAIALAVSGAAAITAGATWFHWRRFRVPITIAAGAAAVTGIVLGLIAYAVGDTATTRSVMLTSAFVLGVGVFGFAMWWDMSDRERTTRRADVAFWLHLLAAPLIVHPVFTGLGMFADGGASVGSAFIVLALYVVLGLVALTVDRRALMVSALAYVLVALSTLFRELGAIGLNLALTALVIGSALLLLSAFWHSVRAAIVGALPETLQDRVPPAQVTAQLRAA